MPSVIRPVGQGVRRVTFYHESSVRIRYGLIVIKKKEIKKIRENKFNIAGMKAVGDASVVS